MHAAPDDAAIHCLLVTVIVWMLVAATCDAKRIAKSIELHRTGIGP